MYKYKIRRLLKIKLGFDYVENISTGKFGDVVLLKSPSGEKKIGKIVWGGQIKQPQLDVWPLLDHENVVRLENTILLPDIEACCFVMTPHYMTLENIVKSEDFRSDEYSIFDMKRWLSDTLSGTNYLHGKKLCHLNIKPSNILISYDSRAKLGGFGFVTSSTAPVSRCGIEYPYLPPERCYSRRRNDVLVDPIGVDLWSLGIMTLQLFTKNMLQVELGNNVMLWSSEVYTEIFEEIKDLEWNIEVSFPEMEISPPDLKRLKNFIRMFLSLKPGDRPSAELGMKHRFLSSGLFMPKVDTAWKKKASKINIEMIVEEQNTLENVRKRCEGRETPGSMNPPLEPHARHQLIKLSESNNEDQREKVRYVKNEELIRTDASKESKNLLEKTLAVASEAKISAWDSVKMPVVEDYMKRTEIDNLKKSRGEGNDIVPEIVPEIYRNQEELNEEKPGSPEQKKKPGIFVRAKTWLVGKLRSFKKS